MDMSIKTLLIEDDAADRLFIKQVLLENERTSYDIHFCECLSTAMEMLEQNSFDIILLDLILSDSYGIDTFKKVFDKYKGIPIVILSGITDELVALDAVRKGAQDYLMKNEITPILLKRIINYAIERNQLMNKLNQKSITDDLTELYNRRGFLNMAHQHLDLARRIEKKIGLFFIDLDGMKDINDRFGHQEGDRALIYVSTVLKECFRVTDLIGHLHGDEFAVLVYLESINDLKELEERVRDKIQKHNCVSADKYLLSVSIGSIYMDPQEDIDIQRSLDKADQLMYQEKAEKKKLNASKNIE